MARSNEKRVPIRLRLTPPIGDTKKATVEVKQSHLTEDVGSFTFGLCQSCDWRGPGRRSREKARDDVKDHQQLCPDKGRTVVAEGRVRKS
ncbi:hypothetical protein [Yimella sp. cx-51]|uniref:hypothetical protein n=1 Tax=Yimella sp. cx-51 TaxID=2770551 RepID=UPI00165E3FAB|nr:hypothetical protein [Yimella sp. cx-51]MBC9955759.1 hypothetical protein [Yimella sp. cx-51]QTH37677.1 hypothetical protein J5M86_12570 [Yimella sp. cx-51]